MKPVVSKFLNGSGKTYLEEAANYLEHRGLTINDAPVIPYTSKNMGTTKDNGDRFDPEGWAFCVLDGNLQPRDNEYLMRVCNVDIDSKFYQVFDGKKKDWNPPKFIQTNKKVFLHYASTFTDVVRAPVITLHEKISSAALTAKLLKVPSMAISGCYGWRNKDGLQTELAKVVGALAPDCHVVVCFDGDIIGNQNIMEAASRLRGEILSLRPDLSVTFPKLPNCDNGVGWDDYIVAHGADGLMEVFCAEGVEVVDVLPLSYLIEHLGVSLTDEKYPKLEQTVENYIRLLRFPRWADYRMDINGDVYCGQQYFGTQDKLCLDFRRWLERSICLGTGIKVIKSKAEEAVAEWLNSRKVSMVLELLREQPAVSYEEARAAAERIVTQGFNVTGPMTLEENVNTVLRMFRDAAKRWSDDRELDNIQWVWCIIGPSGCGKSMFSKFMFDGLADIGYHRVPKSVFTKSNSVKEEDEIRKAASSLVMALDDYNPSANTARDSENRVYTMTSMRTTVQREPYGKRPEEVMLRAVYFLSTTDKTRQFIRSAKGTGERRFIVMEGKGVDMVDGKLRVGKNVLKQAGLDLMTWAAWGSQGCDDGVAEEFSSKYVDQYVQEAPGVVGITGVDWLAFEQNMDKWRRPNGAYHFVIRTMLLPALSQGGRQWSGSINDITNFVEECGAERSAGSCRVNGDGKDVVKTSAHIVHDKEAFIAALRAVL